MSKTEKDLSNSLNEAITKEVAYEKGKDYQPKPQAIQRQVTNELNKRLWMLGGRFRTFTGYGIFTDQPNHKERQDMRQVIGDQLEHKLQNDHQHGRTTSQQDKRKNKE